MEVLYSNYTVNISEEVIYINNHKINADIKKLRELRIKAGYTQVTMAKTIGITKGGYIKIERNEIHPSVVTAKSICDVLKIKFDDIFSIENSE